MLLDDVHQATLENVELLALFSMTRSRPSQHLDCSWVLLSATANAAQWQDLFAD